MALGFLFTGCLVLGLAVLINGGLMGFLATPLGMVGLIVLLTGTLALILVRPGLSLKATNINDSFAEFEGASPKFLESLGANPSAVK